MSHALNPSREFEAIFRIVQDALHEQTGSTKRRSMRENKFDWTIALRRAEALSCRGYGQWTRHPR